MKEEAKPSSSRQNTFLLAAAAITFMIGLAVVSLWLFYRHAGVKEVTRQPQGLSLDTTERAAENSAQSSLRFIYITTPLDVREDYLAGADVVAFSDKGEWSLIAVSVKKDGPKMKIESLGHHGYLARGIWKNSSEGILELVVRRCEHTAEDIPVDGGREVEYPLIVNWRIENGGIGEQGTTLESQNEKFRLLQKDELSGGWLDELFSPTGEPKEKISGRKCLKEDLSVVGISR